MDLWPSANEILLNQRTSSRAVLPKKMRRSRRPASFSPHSSHPVNRPLKIPPLSRVRRVPQLHHVFVLAASGSSATGAPRKWFLLLGVVTTGFRPWGGRRTGGEIADLVRADSERLPHRRWLHLSMEAPQPSSLLPFLCSRGLPLCFAAGHRPLLWEITGPCPSLRSRPLCAAVC
jgi:hypothetical protein